MTPREGQDSGLVKSKKNMDLNFSANMYFTDQNLFLIDQREKLLNFNFEVLQIQKWKLLMDRIWKDDEKILYE